MGNVAPGTPALTTTVRGEEMLQAEVAAMMRLHALGCGAKRLSKEFGCARNTVRRYLRAEPLRIRWGLLLLRRWSHDEENTPVFP